MGYTKTGLIPTKLRMQAIDTNPIEIIGAIIVRLSGLDIQGNSHETTQICYVSNKIKGMYLSEHGCKQLGIISESFPSVGAVDSDNDIAASSSRQPPTTGDTCSCPRRKMPPPLPTSVPLPPTDNNRGKLEEWIRDNYKDSTFNVCEHQPLPLMEGPPVRIMVESITCHHSHTYIGSSTLAGAGQSRPGQRHRARRNRTSSCRWTHDMV